MKASLLMFPTTAIAVTKRGFEHPIPENVALRISRKARKDFNLDTLPSKGVLPALPQKGGSLLVLMEEFAQLLNLKRKNKPDLSYREAFEDVYNFAKEENKLLVIK